MGDSRPDSRPACRRVLFLDVDGVLHPLRVRYLAGTQEIDDSHVFVGACMEQLQRVVRATSCEIVLSSSWRKFEKTRERVALKLSDYGLSCSQYTTVAGDETAAGRVHQISAWVESNRHELAGWAVVDDDDLDTPCGEGFQGAEFRQSFVRTDPNVGLTEAAADLLIAVLLGEDSDAEEAAECTERLVLHIHTLGPYTREEEAASQVVMSTEQAVARTPWNQAKKADLDAAGPESDFGHLTDSSYRVGRQKA